MSRHDTAIADDDSVSRRSFLRATGAAAGAVAVTGLGGTAAAQDGNQTGGNQTGGGDGNGGQAQTDVTLREINATMTTLDPIAATDTASGVVIQQIFDALMNYPRGEQTVDNLLAQDYQRSDDGTSYTFNLVEGATFHNGDPVRAQDFVYSFERLAASDNSRRQSFVLDSLGVQHETDQDGNYQAGSLAVSAPDDTTLEIQLSGPFHAALELLAYTSFAAVPEGIVGDIEGYEGEMEYNQFASSNPVGAGPFQFENWQSGTEASVTRFDDYYGTVPSLAGVHWQIIEDDSAVYNYAMNRNADVFGIPTTQFDPSLLSIERTDDLGREIGTYGPMRNGDTANIARVPTVSSYYVGFNMAAVPKPVRQAFAYAANQQLLVEQVFKNRGDPAYHFTPPVVYPDGIDAYEQHAQEGYPYGVGEAMLDQARQVMEDAGYGPNNRYEVTWTQYQSDTWLEMAQILRDQLTTAHINMQIEQAPFSTLTQRGREGSLQAYTLGWIADWPAPDNFLQLLNPPQTDTGGDQVPISYINWSEETGDAAQQAIDAFQRIQENAAPGEQSQEARGEAAVQMEEANWEDVGFLPIYHAVEDEFWYDWVDYTVPGAMGPSRMKRNEITISDSGNRPS